MEGVVSLYDLSRWWPEKVCTSPDERGYLMEPMRIGEHVVCSNGHVMIVVPDDGREAVEPDHVRLGHLPEIVETALADHNGTTYPLGPLRAWLRAVEEPCPDCDGSGPIQCPECHGEGLVECICMDCEMEHAAICARCDEQGVLIVCDACEDEGVLSPYSGKVAKLNVDSVVVNERLLALALYGAPGKEVSVQALEGTPRLRLAGDGWRALVMGFRRDSVEDMDALAGLTPDAMAAGRES